MDLYLDKPGPGGLSAVASDSTTANASGVGRGSAAIPNVVVSGDTEICVQLNSSSATGAVLHGFLAKDK